CLLPRVIDCDDGLDDAQRCRIVLRRFHKSQAIFRKARTPESRPCVQEFRADAIVEPDAACHLLYVSTNGLAQFGNLVDERDLRRETTVCRVLDELRAASSGEENRPGIEIESAVDLRHDSVGATVIAADYDAVRVFEIVDRGALAKELRVRYDGEVDVRPRRPDNALDVVAGADRNRGLRDDQGKSCKSRRNLLHGGINEREIWI